jgi:hypothetical protein
LALLDQLGGIHAEGLCQLADVVYPRAARRGGLATLRRYGTIWYSALALKRWGRLDAEDLDRARVVGSAHFAELARRSRRRPVREG